MWKQFDNIFICYQNLHHQSKYYLSQLEYPSQLYQKTSCSCIFGVNSVRMQPSISFCHKEIIDHYPSPAGDVFINNMVTTVVCIGLLQPLPYTTPKDYSVFLQSCKILLKLGTPPTPTTIYSFSSINNFFQSCQ